MRLDPFVRDYRSFMDELVDALDAETTRYYLDTSLLMWLIRLGGEARAEFVAWCESRPTGAVRVPVWAAHELHRHLIAGTVAKEVQRTVSEIEGKLDEFVRLASERADEAVCKARGYAGRNRYVSEIEQSFARVRQLCKVANDDTKLSAAADQVIDLVNKYVLETDLAPIVTSLGQTGEFRYSHLMPPGYHDKKDENRYGDVVIWEEMVEDFLQTGGETRRHAILVSRDKKTDWVSSAPLIRGRKAESEKANRDLGLDVARAHPLLVHEFATRAKGDRLYIIQPGFLASTLDYSARKANRSSAVTQWLAAAHRPDFLGRLAAISLPVEEAAVAPSVPTGAGGDHRAKGVAAPPVAPQNFVPPSLKEIMGARSPEEIRAYEGAIPAERSQFFVTWLDRLKSGSLPPFKLGRLFADLVLSGHVEWTTQIPGLIEQLSAELDQVALNGVVLGVIAPAYFDRYGEVLRKPNSALGAAVLALESDVRLEPAFRTLRGYLEGADAELPYSPGSGRGQVRYVLDLVEGAGSGPRVLRDLRVGGQSALVDPMPLDGIRRLSRLLDRAPAEGCTGLELRALVAREYLIPAELLNSDSDKRRLTWNPNAGLAAPDTGSAGGLSALVDDGEQDDD